MTWKPNSSISSAVNRARMLRGIRDFFAQREVLEVNTPALSSRTATDPNIESIVAQANNQQAYLNTSPEHHMKRLLAAGFPDIYQVSQVYRDGESGRHHLPEFTMLEWYRLGFELSAIMDDTIELVSALLQKDFTESALRLSYADAFKQTVSLDPLTADIETLAAAADADEQLKASIGDDRDSWLDLVMASKVATTFGTNQLTVVYHYPRSQAALARICPSNGQVADRFEVYWGTLELANGFVELTDANEQRERFQADQRKREASGRMRHELDEKLIDALDAGLPACAGVALGIDRLLMIDEGVSDIHSVVTFTPGS